MSKRCVPADDEAAPAKRPRAGAGDGGIRACIRALVEGGGAVTADMAAAAMGEIMGGTATDAQKGAFLTALSLDRATPEVVAACADAMRGVALPCVPGCEVVDVVGTGGDGIDTFNVSTAASIVVAAAGGKVLKHGNRSNSSKCGSADVLEALGGALAVDGAQAVAVMRECGFCFLFAQRFHPAMRHVGAVRRQLGVRTIFNILGPLTNPARASYYATGVYDRALGPLFAQTFVRMGVRRAVVAHSDEGLDELSIAGPTHLWVVRDGEVTERDVTPDGDFGLPRHPLSAVAGGEPEQNVATFRDVIGGKPGPCADYTVLNAAVAIWIAGMAPTLREAADKAREAITSGRALRVLNDYVRLSQEQVGGAAAKPASILREIADHRRTVTTAAARAAVPMDALVRRALASPPLAPLDVVERLRRGSPRVALMAEIKRASPSRGVINDAVDPAERALAYARAGAAVVSVLTEPKWFRGAVDDLRAVVRAIAPLGDSRPAVLLKDFVTEEYQLVEARAAGADTALLIVALLDDAQLAALMAQSRALGMEPLVEVATADEMRRATAAGARLVGVNNRNLHDFTVDTGRTTRLASMAGDGVVLAALSGIKTHADVRGYVERGAHAVLVGETLMVADDPVAKAAELLGDLGAPQPLVKV